MLCMINRGYSFGMLLLAVQSLSHVRFPVTPWTAACSWDSPGKNTGVDYHALLQGIFLIQGTNLHLMHLLTCRWIFLPLTHWGSLI